MLYKINVYNQKGSSREIIRDKTYKLTENFTAGELACPLTKQIQISGDFLSLLQDVRDEFGRPMNVNSCCRSRQHNKLVKGHPSSLHLMDNPKHKTNGTLAIDISLRTMSEDDKADLFDIVYQKGLSVGISETFMHIDNRQEIGLQQRIWSY